MGLGNPLEVVVNHILIGGMVGLSGECTSVHSYTLDMTYGES